MKLKVAVVGVGALGGFIAARLILAGHAVRALELPATCTVLLREGLCLVSREGHFSTVRPEVYSSAERIGPVDVLILTVKTHHLLSLAKTIPLMVGPETRVITLQNGLPWWYPKRHDPALPSAVQSAFARRLDPTGDLNVAVTPAQIIGGVAYPAVSLRRPGEVVHVEGERFTLGKLDGTSDEVLDAIVELFGTAGLRTVVTADIRGEIWLKAIGAAAFNPIGALTGASMAQTCEVPETESLARQIMEEAASIAGALGVNLRVSVERRLAGAARVGQHKTSMLQDIEAGRRSELEGVVGIISALGAALNIDCPRLNSVYALMKLRETSGDLTH